MELSTVKIEIPQDANVIIGQSHFIKSVEDIYEAITSTVPQAKFGFAFSEASGPCLIRYDGNDDELKKLAIGYAQNIACGHSFIIILKNAYPINILNTIQNVPEVCRIFCATANPLEVIVAQSEQGRGILGVIDGEVPKGIETAEHIKERIEFLKKVGYKR